MPPKPAPACPQRSGIVVLATLLALAWSPRASANGGDGDLQWNGYLNVVGGIMKHQPYSSNHPDSRHPDRLAYSDQFTFDEETSAGLQATRLLEGGNSITAQVFAKGNENNYAAQMKWLYYSHNIDDHQRLRIGRIGTPLYYFSDYLNVGYAYHWVTPPRAVYFFDATVTGLDYEYRFAKGHLDGGVELFAGTADQYQQVIDATTHQRNIRGIIGNFTLSNRLMLRTLLLRQSYSIEFQSLNTDSVIDQGFESAIDAGLFDEETAASIRPSFEPVMRPLIDDMLDIQDEPLDYAEVALRYEDPLWFLMLESIRIDVDTYLLPVTEAWYLSGGFRTGPLLWHATWTELRQPLCDDCRADYLLTQGAPSGNLAEFFARKIRSTVAYQETDPARNISVGVTIETSPSSLLKVEIERLRDYASVPTETAGVGSNILLRTALCVTF